MIEEIGKYIDIAIQFIKAIGDVGYRIDSLKFIE